MVNWRLMLYSLQIFLLLFSIKRMTKITAKSLDQAKNKLYIYICTYSHCIYFTLLSSFSQPTTPCVCVLVDIDVWFSLKKKWVEWVEARKWQRRWAHINDGHTNDNKILRPKTTFQGSHTAQTEQIKTRKICNNF